jgi:hypothetical protein
MKKMELGGSEYFRTHDSSKCLMLVEFKTINNLTESHWNSQQYLFLLFLLIHIFKDTIKSLEGKFGIFL